jgi:two-component system response regulator
MRNKAVEILLVEDNKQDIELAVHALRREHLANAVDVVQDGEEALDYLFCRGAYADRSPADAPRVVLLDLKLPKVDGIEVLRALKQNPLTRAIPVVVLTASREERDLVDSYRLGVNSYIQKPVDFKQFQETVKQLGLFWLVVNQPPPARAFQVES